MPNSVSGITDRNYSLGGFSWSDDGSGPSTSGTDIIGRWWNNLTGKTASNQFTSEEAEKARIFNSAEAQKERDWQTMMSNTAYQRAVNDMKAAGINPASLGGDGTMSPASTGNSARAAGSPSPSAAGSGGSFLDIVLGALKMAVWKNISNSSLSVEKDKMAMNKVLSDARAADAMANTALKEQKLGKASKYEKALADFKKAQEKEFARLSDPNRVVS